MLNNRLEAATLVATELFALEASMDQAISQAAAMVAVLPKATQTGRLAATVGQDAFAGAGTVLQQLIEARASVVALHADLHTIQHDIGLGARAMGDGWKAVPKPNGLTGVEEAPSHLTVVASAA
jgi:streptomycin 6-kinase